MSLIDGKVAILTGAGRGIGAATAKLFGAEGAAVVVSDLDPAPAEETAAAIRTAGGKAIVVSGDVTDPAFPAQLIKATLDSFGGIDIIVNNAGYTWDAVIQNMTDKQWYAMIDVHTTAPFRILREASQFIRDAAKKEQAANGRANPRKVVNVSSVAGVYGNAGQANYSTAKAGITGLTKTLAKEWGRYNVQVNCVCYGFIDTRLTAAKESAEKVQRGDDENRAGSTRPDAPDGSTAHSAGKAGDARGGGGTCAVPGFAAGELRSGIVLEVTGGRAI